MSNTIHVIEESLDLFIEKGAELGTKFIEMCEQHNLCPACFLSYIHAFLADTMVNDDPSLKDSIISGMIMTARQITGKNIVFLDMSKQQATSTMETVSDAFLDEMSNKSKGKLN